MENNSTPESTDPFSRPSGPPPPPPSAPYSSPPPPLQVKYAGFGIRLLAYFIDAAIVLFVAWLIWGDEVAYNNGKSMGIQMNGAKNLLWFAYFIPQWMLLSTSIGKIICRIKIVGESGQKMNPKEAGIRMVVYIFLIIGAWFILGSERKQALHDKAAKTYVVRI